MKCEFLNSNESFVVIPAGGATSYYWIGEGATELEGEYSKKLGPILAPSAAHSGFKEGSEVDEFWTALGGKTEYLSVKDLGIMPGFEARLFNCSNA